MSTRTRFEEEAKGNSEMAYSNASGTGSERVSAQGLVSISQLTFTTDILSTRLTAPGSPRMAVKLLSILLWYGIAFI